MDDEDTLPLTEKQKKLMGDAAKKMLGDLVASVNADAPTCPLCKRAATVTRHGRDWTAECRICDWSAAGSNYVEPRFN